MYYQHEHANGKDGIHYNSQTIASDRTPQSVRHTIGRKTTRHVSRYTPQYVDLPSVTLFNAHSAYHDHATKPRDGIRDIIDSIARLEAPDNLRWDVQSWRSRASGRCEQRW